MTWGPESRDHTTVTKIPRGDIQLGVNKKKHKLFIEPPTLPYTDQKQLQNPQVLPKNTTPLDLKHRPPTRNRRSLKLTLISKGISRFSDSTLSSLKGLGWWQHLFSSKVIGQVVLLSSYFSHFPLKFTDLDLILLA